ncbi:MAG: hypothetical protein VX278_01885, partial [Myxococcota bacterium]|nr:hypothetical protein [Myxococcota bacterium]
MAVDIAKELNTQTWTVPYLKGLYPDLWNRLEKKYKGAHTVELRLSAKIKKYPVFYENLKAGTVHPEDEEAIRDLIRNGNQKISVSNYINLYNGYNDVVFLIQTILNKDSWDDCVGELRAKDNAFERKMGGLLGGHFQNLFSIIKSFQ